MYELEIMVVWAACNNTTPLQRDEFMHSDGFTNWMILNGEKLLEDWAASAADMLRRAVPSPAGWNA